MRKSFPIFAAVALVAAAALYHMHSLYGWSWINPLLEGRLPEARIVPHGNGIARGEPLGVANGTEIALVEEATPVTDSEQVLPSASEIVVMDEDNDTTSAPARIAMPAAVPELVALPVVSRRDELAAQLALLLAATADNRAGSDLLIADTRAWAQAVGDTNLQRILAALERAVDDLAAPQEAPQAVASEEPGWLSRWMKIYRHGSVSANATTQEGLEETRDALLDELLVHFHTHYPRVEGR